MVVKAAKSRRNNRELLREGIQTQVVKLQKKYHDTNFHDPVKHLYKELKNSEIRITPHFQNYLFVSEIEQNQALAKYIVTLKHCGDNHN